MMKACMLISWLTLFPLQHSPRRAFESSIKYSGDVNVSRAGEVKLLDTRLTYIILPKSACAPRYNSLKAKEKIAHADTATANAQKQETKRERERESELLIIGIHSVITPTGSSYIRQWAITYTEVWFLTAKSHRNWQQDVTVLFSG